MNPRRYSPGFAGLEEEQSGREPQEAKESLLRLSAYLSFDLGRVCGPKPQYQRADFNHSPARPVKQIRL
jgi:hypothetical protein